MEEGEIVYMLDLEGVTVRFNKNIALEEISLKVEYPSLLVVMGPNGAGKTTLLRTILGFIKPVKGEIRVLGIDPIEDPGKLRLMVGYVPQKENISLNVPLRAIDVVLMGILSKKRFPRLISEEERKLALDMLDLVGLRDLHERRFRDLSSGQQQRVLIARALASDPKLLLLDEPLSPVDVESKFEIAVILDCLKRERRIGIVMVTHDVNPVMEYVDKAVLLNKRVIAFGPPEEVFREEILNAVYGRRAKTIKIGGRCYVMTSDFHVGH